MHVGYFTDEREAALAYDAVRMGLYRLGSLLVLD